MYCYLLFDKKLNDDDDDDTVISDDFALGFGANANTQLLWMHF